MPCRKYKTWQLLLILLLSVTLPMATIITLAQEKSRSSNGGSKSVEEACKGSHTVRDFYKNVRQLPPSTVLEIVDYRLNYAIAEEGIELGSLQIEPDWTSLPPGFGPKNHVGCYGILYCEKHKVALQVNILDSKFCHTIKL